MEAPKSTEPSIVNLEEIVSMKLYILNKMKNQYHIIYGCCVNIILNKIQVREKNKIILN